MHAFNSSDSIDNNSDGRDAGIINDCIWASSWYFSVLGISVLKLRFCGLTSLHTVHRIPHGAQVYSIQIIPW